MTLELRERMVECARGLMSRKGCELLGFEGDEFDIVAMDDGVLVVMDVDGQAYTGRENFPSDRVSRDDVEWRMARLLLANPELRDLAAVPIRYDRCDMLVLDGSEALIRHHVGALQ